VVRAQLVRRPHLTRRLTEGAPGPLTLVSAPAGFGTTPLLAQFLPESGLPSAWLSLAEQDNDPACLLRDLVAALRTIAAPMGDRLLGYSSLRSPCQPMRR